MIRVLPDPKPILKYKTVVLEFSEGDAETLYYLGCRNIIIPDAIAARDDAQKRPAVESFLNRVTKVLREVGVKD